MIAANQIGKSEGFDEKTRLGFWLGKGLDMPLSKMLKSSLLLAVCMFVCSSSLAQTSARIQKLSGMWSDPPVTIIGQFCAGWCTDAGIDQLNAQLDDPAND